jgi:hypothetical protein
MTENDLKLDKWLEEVADKCHEFASNKNFDLDFYVFQSAIHFNPKLMFIGANPGGGKSYSEKNNEEKRNRRTKDDLGQDANTFVKYYNDPKWGRLKPLYDIFKGNSLMEQYFIDSVITNLSYFNSGTYSNLIQKMRFIGKEPLSFCIQKNLELINEIIKPQNIILMGAPARNNFFKYFDNKRIEIILETNSYNNKKGVALIGKSFMFGKPVYIIAHPTAWNGQNNEHNIILKRNKFNEIFSKD